METGGAAERSAISGTAAWHLLKPWRRTGVHQEWKRPQMERTQKRTMYVGGHGSDDKRMEELEGQVVARGGWV